MFRAQSLKTTQICVFLKLNAMLEVQNIQNIQELRSRNYPCSQTLHFYAPHRRTSAPSRSQVEGSRGLGPHEFMLTAFEQRVRQDAYIFLPVITHDTYNVHFFTFRLHDATAA
jgi:hypothetical protein